MAACSEVEEKASFSKDSVPSKIFIEETAGHSKLSSELIDKTKEQLQNMSEHAFQGLLEDIVTYKRKSSEKSDVYQALCRELSETHEKSKGSKYSDYKYKNLSDSSNHKSLDDKKKISKNREDLKNVLNSDKDIQPSETLQNLPSPELKIKKSHKTLRTLSSSSEEAANIICDSLVKNTKKTNKLSSNTKNQSNKSVTSKSNSKILDNSGSASGDSGHKRKFESLVQNSTLPYEPLINDCDIPLPDEPGPENKEKSTSGSPIEIEMEEIKSDKVSSKDDKLIIRTVEKNKNTLTQGSSKFYIDSDIDSTANCSIQFDPYPTSLEDQNGGQINYATHWSEAQPNFLTRITGSEDFFSTRSDKQLLSTDINGNPFSRSPRSSLASIMSTTILDYNNSSLVSENKNRKNKRSRNAVNGGVLSENIAGHRGQEDIDSLLQFINSSDKKGKSPKGNSQSHFLSSKSVFHENDRKKGFGKDVKNGHKNMISGVKKKLSRSNSLENLTSNKNVDSEKCSALSYESKAMIDKPLKGSKSAILEHSNKKKLDINSNIENRFSDVSVKKSYSLDEPVEASYNYESTSEVSSFAADFYSTADVSSQTVEEAGFLVVKKKQRKKHQGKRSDSYRWRNAQNQRKKGIMLPLAESKCGKQDSRRKSTSSVPHSEHSSADNSDLDSVHSLPVRGSVPHPTQPHPHTTPSSSSSTPQASYADIARMPITKLNSPSPCIITYSVQSSVVKQQTIGDPEFRKPDNSVSNFSHVKKKVGDARDSLPVSNKSTVRVESTDDDTFSDVKLRSSAKSTREINTQTEPEPSTSENISLENVKTSKKLEECKSSCTVCLCTQKKNCSCSKSQTHIRHKIKSSDIPPVIMDNIPDETNTCNVSFGFGVEEVLQMTPSETSELTVASIDSEIKDLHISEKIETPVSNNPQSDNSSRSSVNVSLKETQNSDLPSETSSHLQTVCYGTGRNICYSETKVNTKKFNLSEITNYLGMEFQCIEKELGLSKSTGVSSKVVYYTDSTDEA